MKLFPDTSFLIYSAILPWIIFNCLSAELQPEKVKIGIGAILTKYGFGPKIAGVLKYTIVNGVKKSRSYKLLNDSYDINSVPPILEVDFHRLTPNDIMTFLCDEILANNVNLLIYLLDQERSGKSAAVTDYLVKIANSMGLPIIAWLKDDNSGLAQTSSDSIVVQMTPSVTHQCKAMLSLLRHYNWSSFSIVTSKLAGHEYFINNLRKMVDSSNADKIIDVIKLVSFEDPVIAKNLQTINDGESRVILFYGSKKEAETIFRIARERKLKILGKEFVWIVSKSVVGEGSGYFRKLSPGLLGLKFKVAPARTDQKNVIQHAVELWAMGMQDMLKSVTDDSLRKNILSMNKSCDSITPSDVKWKGGEQLYHNIIKQKIERENVEFEPDGTLTHTEFEIVNLKSTYGWAEIGHWSSKTGIAIDDIYWSGDSPTPPSGRPAKYQLKVVTLDEDPYVKYSDPDPITGECPAMSFLCRLKPENETSKFNGSTTDPEYYRCASGLCIDLLATLASEIGFEFDLFQVYDRRWGGYDKETGDWNGLVKAVRDHEADMAMTSLKSTPERNTQIDFSVPFLETGITIIVAVRDGVITPTAFLRPFDIVCWIIILVMCIQVLAVAVFLFEWLSPLGFNLQKHPVSREPYDYPSWCMILVFSVHACGAAIFIFEWLSPNGLDRGNKPIREHRFSLFRSFWLIWSMLFGAAVNVDNPRGVSSRFLANIWALFAVVFTASYTANLATFMITKADYDRLTGLEDPRLLFPEREKPAYKFATIPHGSTDTNIRNNNLKMYNYMKPLSKETVAEGIKAVKDSELNAFIYDASVLEFKASQDDKCMLKTVGKWSALTGYGIAFPKNSKWIGTFNEKLLKLQHDGTLERLQKFWLAGTCKYKSDEETKSQSLPLGILNFTSAFILLAAGMLFGGLLLLLEHVYFKFFRAKLRKMDKCGCCGLISLSMGKSLTFEQSVREAIELQKHHKCKNPICETQTWKIKHELDLALLKIDRLSKQLGENGIAPDRRAVWRDSHVNSMGQFAAITPPSLRKRRSEAPKTNPNYHPSSQTLAYGWKIDSSDPTEFVRSREPLRLMPKTGPNISALNTVQPAVSPWQPSHSQSTGIWYSPQNTQSFQRPQRTSWQPAKLPYPSYDACGAPAEPGPPHQSHLYSSTRESFNPAQQPTISGIQPYSSYQGVPYGIPYDPSVDTPCTRHSPRYKNMIRSKSLPGSPIKRATPTKPDSLSRNTPASTSHFITRTISFPESPGKQRRRVYQGNVYSQVNKSDPFIFEKETVL